MRKRSRAVALTILGAASFAIAGCREEQVDAQAFPDLASCQAAAAQGGFVELVFDEPGTYTVVNHSFVEMERGARALIRVTA